MSSYTAYTFLTEHPIQLEPVHKAPWHVTFDIERVGELWLLKTTFTVDQGDIRGERLVLPNSVVGSQNNLKIAFLHKKEESHQQALVWIDEHPEVQCLYHKPVQNKRVPQPITGKDDKIKWPIWSPHARVIDPSITEKAEWKH